MAGSRNKSARKAGGGQDGTARQRFLESAGAALIAGLVVVLVGNLIATLVQNRARENEVRLSIIKESFDQEHEMVRRSADLVWNSVSASEALIAISGENFDPARYPDVVGQRTAIKKTYNERDAQWRAENPKLTSEMSYHHSGQPDVVAAWAGVQKATTEYMDCAKRWHEAHETAPVANPDAACKAERDAVTGRSDALNARIGEWRRRAWQEWVLPEYPWASPSATPAHVASMSAR